MLGREGTFGPCHPGVQQFCIHGQHISRSSCGVSALIHLISFKLFQNNLLACNIAVALRKFKAVLLSEGLFPFLLCDGISALIFCHQNLVMGWYFTVLSYLYFSTWAF